MRRNRWAVQPRPESTTAGSRRAALRLGMLRAIGPALRRLSAPTPHRPVEQAADPRRPRILLIRPDHVGDVLLAAPAGSALRQALGGARVDWLVGPWSEEVIRRAGAADAVMTCAFPGFTRRPKASSWAPYVELARQARALRGRAYDIALILRPDHWWGAMLTTAAGIPTRLGYAVPECRPFLTHALPLRVETHALEQNRGLARLAVDLLRPCTDLPDSRPTFRIEPDERGWTERLLAHHDIGPDGPLAAIHPGSGSYLKNWLPDRWRAVAEGLRAVSGAPIVLTGGTAERRLLDEIAVGLEPRPLLLAGRTTLGQLAALFERCAVVLGGDSGPLHLAAAVGTPTVRLYGPTDPAIFGPAGPSDRHAIIRAQLPCQPCGNIVDPPCDAVSTPACLRVIPAEDVIRAALGRIAGEKSPLPLGEG